MKTQKTTDFPLSETDRAALTTCKEQGEALLARFLEARQNLADVLEKQIGAIKAAAGMEARVKDAPEDMEAIRELRDLREQAGLFEQQAGRISLEIDTITGEFRPFWYAADDALRTAAKSMLPDLIEKAAAAFAPFCRTKHEARDTAAATSAVGALQHYGSFRVTRSTEMGIGAARALELAPAQLEKIARILDGEPAWKFETEAA